MPRCSVSISFARGISFQPNFGSPISGTIIRFFPARQRASDGFDHNYILLGLTHNERGHATGRIAAGLGLGAVLIVNRHEQSCLGVLFGFEDNELIAADAGFPVGDGGNFMRRRRARPVPEVEDHEVVAKAVHLDKSHVFQSFMVVPGRNIGQNPRKGYKTLTLNPLPPNFRPFHLTFDVSVYGYTLVGHYAYGRKTCLGFRCLNF